MEIGNYLLGDAALHHRLGITTGILGELMMRAPQSVSIRRLEDAIGYPAQEVEKICQHMWRNGLVQPDPAIAGNWMLAGSPSDITLEHVFRAVMAEGAPKGSLLSMPPAHLSADVDLLVMQAAVGVNQGVFNHLRRFPLDRLKMRGGMFPSTGPRSRGTCFEELPVVAASA
jgi:DNA-binding IscR family transcriptional regulator